MQTLRKLPKRSPTTKAQSWKMPRVPTGRVYGFGDETLVRPKTGSPDLSLFDGILYMKRIGGGGT